MRYLLPLLFLNITHAAELVCAGGNEVFIVDAAKAEAGVIEKLWRWSGEDALECPQRQNHPEFKP